MESRGKRLKRLREEMRLTESDLSNYLKIDSEDVIDLENDNGKLNLTILNKLCDLYCCDEKYILCMSDEYDPPYAFRSNDIACEDLEALAKINRIYKNTKYLLQKRSELEN